MSLGSPVDSDSQPREAAALHQRRWLEAIKFDNLITDLEAVDNNGSDEHGRRDEHAAGRHARNHLGQFLEAGGEAFNEPLGSCSLRFWIQKATFSQQALTGFFDPTAKRRIQFGQIIDSPIENELGSLIRRHLLYFAHTNCWAMRHSSTLPIT
jgi:hypothetical protein